MDETDTVLGVGIAMSQTPGKKDNDDAGLSPKGQKKFSTLAIGGILVLIAAVMIFVVASAILNGT